MTHRMKCTPGWYETEKWGYLKSYDPEAYGGRGEVTFTGSIDEAMEFADRHAAWACYFQVPKCAPSRPDGRPNRPLTAYTIFID